MRSASPAAVVRSSWAPRKAPEYPTAALLTERTQVVQDVLFHPVREGAQDRVEGFLGHCRVNVLGGQSAHKELEAIVKPHLLRPQDQMT